MGGGFADLQFCGGGILPDNPIASSEKIRLDSVKALFFGFAAQSRRLLVVPV
ncbi:MAG: hypothetical protein ACI376_07355 [Candidatus Bruticola sp.]